MEVKRLNYNDNEVQIDFRDSGEVWVWTGENAEDGEFTTRISFMRRDLEEILDNMEYLWQMEQVYDLLSDELGGDLDKINSREWDRAELTRKLTQQIDRNNKYINTGRAREIVDEVLDA